MRTWVSHNVLPLAFAFVLLIWILVGCVSWKAWMSVKNEDMAANGQYGDTFGSANSLFAGLAFVALIYTLKLQQEQIRHASDSSGIAQFFELTRYLETIRDDRRTVYSLSETRGVCLSWTDEEQQAAERVCAAFNLAGILRKRTTSSRAWS